MKIEFSNCFIFLIDPKVEIEIEIEIEIEYSSCHSRSPQMIMISLSLVLLALALPFRSALAATHDAAVTRGLFRSQCFASAWESAHYGRAARAEMPTRVLGLTVLVEADAWAPTRRDLAAPLETTNALLAPAGIALGDLVRLFLLAFVVRLRLSFVHLFVVVVFGVFLFAGGCEGDFL